MAPSKIRLGTASPGTQATTAETLAQLELLALRAAGMKIDILLLPEAYIGGYPRGTHFGSVIGSRSQEGREEYLSYFQSAVDLGDTVGDGAGAGQAWVNRELPSDVITGSGGGEPAPNRRGDGTREELERIARETGIFIVTGLIERAGGSLYCSAVYVCPKLGMIGKRRKVMPTGTERLVWAQGSPATLRAVSTTIRGVRINLAAAICWENYMPLVRQALYAQNINLYLAPTADGRDAWLPLLRTAAIEGRCFVISSNMCVRKSPTAPTPAAPTASNTNGHPTTTSSSAVHDEADDKTDGADEPDPSPLSRSTSRPGSTTHRRRNSCLTEEGFEIALPCSPTTTTTAHREARPRRQSIFDEDGNEIVLCASTSSNKRPASKSKEPTTTRPTTTTINTTTTIASGSTATATATTAAAAAAEAAGRKSSSSSSSESFSSRGGSAIVSPFGDVLAGPQWEDDAGIIYADVDFDDCIRGRLDLDTAGSYSRNDSFKLEVRGLDLTPLPY
ncbi:carbon-nitrogen hydrolase [Chaetomium strumarium]|uniref:Carbon-nitrogen hydrolase n=1 Tax=Chaetomium strumarium TaxID=1170767 RepID=A0AAJ0GR78_9PEZI|nr:carbon-nitrogen hydrolase [Chaetomium strumarium]